MRAAIRSNRRASERGILAAHDMKRRVLRLVSHVFVGGALLLASACATTGTKTRALPPRHGALAYRIECVGLPGCWSAAHKACHGSYRVESKRENVNTIPESELPGLNAQTQANGYQNATSYGTSIPGGMPTYGPGIESDEPMPVSEVVVVCTSGN